MPKPRLVSALIHVHVVQLKSACVRVNSGARNQPMRAERKIANGTWQRAFFRDKRSRSCSSEPSVRCRATNKQALTTKNKGCWVLAEENPGGYHIWPSESFPAIILWTENPRNLLIRECLLIQLCVKHTVYMYSSFYSFQILKLNKRYIFNFLI